MKVFGYIRVSSKSQVEGDGPERQRIAIEKFCAAHKLELVRVFFEEGVSGTVDGMARPQFFDMVETARNEHIDGIVVERMDRLARDLMVSEAALKECRSRGVKVFAADHGALLDVADDDADPTRVLIRQFMAALAQWEKTNIVAKLNAARARLRALNGPFNGQIPYEWGTLWERERMAYMLELWESHKHLTSDYARFKAIADALNKAGHRTRKQTFFTRESVGELLRGYWKRQKEGVS